MLHLNDLGDILLKASNQNTIRLSCPCTFNTLSSSVKSILESIDVDLSLIEGCFRYYEDKDNIILILYGTLNVDFKMVHDANQKNIFISFIMAKGLMLFCRNMLIITGVSLMPIILILRRRLMSARSIIRDFARLKATLRIR